jgi:nucleoid-associated protein YgaU
VAYQGYHFFVGDLELPYAPSELKVTIGSNNKVVDLINGNEINVLKNPKLTEIKFDIELPRGRQYAFANKLISSKTYTDYFEKLMLNKTPTKLVITRPNPALLGSTGIGGTIKDFESTVLTVSLEGYALGEDAENAYDLTVSLKFKEYVDYGTVKKTIVSNKNTNSTIKASQKVFFKNKTYEVKAGDTLWAISKKFYGVSTYWESIYSANRKTIEHAALKHGRKSSSKGHWIYPGTQLTIPAGPKKR